MWLTGLVAPQHVGSSQTRARTRVPCIDRQILNHCATREAQYFLYTQMHRSVSRPLGPQCKSSPSSCSRLDSLLSRPSGCHGSLLRCHSGTFSHIGTLLSWIPCLLGLLLCFAGISPLVASSVSVNGRETSESYIVKMFLFYL